MLTSRDERGLASPTYSKMTQPLTLTMEEIREELSEKEIAELDFQAYANVIRESSIALVHRVNSELIIPITEWMDDPDFIAKIDIEDEYVWRNYRRQQREANRRWTEHQKQIASEQMRLRHEAVRRRKDLRKDIASLKTHTTDSDSLHREDSGLDMSHLIGMFSPSSIHKRDIGQDFDRFTTVHITTLLPWKTLLRADITRETSFSSLPTYNEDKRQDTISKFQHLLQMDTDGEIRLEQTEPYHDITIIPEATPDPAVRITDRAGTRAELDWSELSDAQRSKVIADATNHKIICKSA